MTAAVPDGRPGGADTAPASINVNTGRRLLVACAVIWGAWTVIGLATGLNQYLLARSSGWGGTFGEMLYRPLLEHWIWAALTPAILFVSQRISFSKETAVRALLLHALFFLFVSVAHSAIADWIRLPNRYPVNGFHGSRLELRFLQEFYSDIWMYWPLVCIQNLVDYYRKYRDRELRAAQLQAQLTSSELHLLRAQLQPHFLFNTLNSISALIQDDPQGAEDMLADLSEMFRVSTLSTGAPEVSLREEIGLLHAYVRIQKKRLGDRLTVHFDVAPEALKCSVPSLLLQPLVENAIHYAVAPRTEASTIWVRAALTARGLRLEVIDNGPGLPEPYHEGVGIGNTRARLRQMYAGEHSFELLTKRERGLSVRIIIPYRRAPEPREERLYEAPHVNR